MSPTRCRLFAFFGLLSSTVLAGAQMSSSLPPTPITTNALPAPISATSAGSQGTGARHRARVTYVGGLLSVSANNSSLNGILRDIAQSTGMKLTGTVGDQRVFGTYGPAEPSTVLVTLLDGTGTNMILRETADNGPRELILTPRVGAPTPPNPYAQNDDDEADLSNGNSGSQQPQQVPATGQTGPSQPLPSMQTGSNPSGQQQFGPRSIPQPWNNVLGSPNNTTQSPSTMPTYQSVPTDSISTPSVAQPVSGIVDSANPPPPGSTTMGSSTPTNTDNLGNGTAKTPEQIYRQLQQMRQSQQQQSTPNSNSPAPQ